MKKTVVDYAEFVYLAKERYEQSGYVQLAGDNLLDQVVSCASTRAKVASQPGPPKEEHRLYRKIAKQMRCSPGKTLKDALNDVTDFARGRILVHYLRDRLSVWKCLCQLAPQHDCTIDPKPDDCNELPRILKDDKLGEKGVKESGWRGIKLVLRFMGEQVPYEVQILTYLQHDWDQKEHVIYEDPNAFPKHVRKAYYNISTVLNKADLATERLLNVVDDYRSSRLKPKKKP